MHQSGIAFHVHHDSLGEFCYDLDERLGYINSIKPEGERKLRKVLLKIIPDELLPDTPLKTRYDKTRAAYDKARAAYYKASAAYDEATAAYDKAWAAYDKTRAACDKAWAAYLSSIDIDALHQQICHPNCPWDGRSIFSKGTSLSVLEEVS